MEQRDYLMKQFEQLGIVLAALLGFKAKGEYQKGFEIIAKGYKEIPGFDQEILGVKDPEIFLHKLLQETPTSYEQLNLIADFVYEEGEFLFLSGEKDKAMDRYKKAETVFIYLEQNEGVFSMERSSKLEKIRRIWE